MKVHGQLVPTYRKVQEGNRLRVTSSWDDTQEEVLIVTVDEDGESVVVRYEDGEEVLWDLYDFLVWARFTRKSVEIVEVDA